MTDVQGWCESWRFAPAVGVRAHDAFKMRVNRAAITR